MAEVAVAIEPSLNSCKYPFVSLQECFYSGEQRELCCSNPVSKVYTSVYLRATDAPPHTHTYTHVHTGVSTFYVMRSLVSVLRGR